MAIKMARGIRTGKGVDVRELERSEIYDEIDRRIGRKQGGDYLDNRQYVSEEEPRESLIKNFVGHQFVIVNGEVAAAVEAFFPSETDEERIVDDLLESRPEEEVRSAFVGYVYPQYELPSVER